MKKVMLLAVVGLGGFMLTATGCKKYEDGPTISFVSRENRISNTWKFESATKDGFDVMNDPLVVYPGSRLDINKNGSFTWYSNIANVTGAWAFQSNDEEVRLSFPAPLGEQVWTILRLKEDSFWVKYIENGSTYEFHFVQA